MKKQPRNLKVWFQVTHCCGHTSFMQGVKGANCFSDIRDEDMEPELRRLQELPCRKCWIRENGYQYTGTFCVDIPKGI